MRRDEPRPSEETAGEEKRKQGKTNQPLTLLEILREEYKLIQLLVHFHPENFLEGIRAVLVDKDRQPKWCVWSLVSRGFGTLFSSLFRVFSLGMESSELQTERDREGLPSLVEERLHRRSLYLSVCDWSAIFLSVYGAAFTTLAHSRLACVCVYIDRWVDVYLHGPLCSVCVSLTYRQCRLAIYVCA